MQLSILDNGSKNLLSALLPAIEQSKETRIAVAFMSKGGLSAIDTAIDYCLKKGGYAEFLVGLDLSMTEPEALWKLYEQLKSGANMQFYCYADLGSSGIYHPKLYMMSGSQETLAVIGSSNLTIGGLKQKHPSQSPAAATDTKGHGTGRAPRCRTLEKTTPNRGIT